MTEFKKRHLLLIYGSAYVIIAFILTFLFTAIIGDWTFRGFILNFSMWGIIWIVSMFGYPMFFLDADPTTLSIDPAFSVLAYFVIIAGLFITYQLHVKTIENKLSKELSIGKILNLYFPIKKKSATETGGNKK
ncbi:MAG: hypothetical protein KAU62_01360 [Candidatus Heimdallarchaeota archaeon]|nr:hypothetical protein [Candidatus Heimdallarchaeota archaeon]MCG3254701.1 hypothetical protein [Candidatus Heimdallarchaeota archaeon]MCK4609782.1 hypothetical protein [Candidatus Heimdallarchaeota archaeon]